MNLINHLVESFILASHEKVNHFDLEEHKGRYQVENTQDLKLFLERVNDTAEFAHFVFLNNSRVQTDAKQLVQMLSYPLVFFLKTTEIKPILVQHIEGKIHYQLFDKTGVTSLEYNSLDDFLKEICTVNDVKLLYGFETNLSSRSSAGEGIEDEIFFLTGFSVKPIFSRIPHPEEEVKVQKIHPIRRLMLLMAIERREIRYIYFFAVVMGAVYFTIPLGIQAIITMISGGAIINSMIVLAAMIVFATGFSGYLQVLLLSYVEILQQRVFAKAAFEFSFRVPRIKLEAIHKEYGPELMNRFFDVLTIQKSLPKFLIDITIAVLQIVFGLFLLSFYHPLFVFFGLFLFALLIVIFRISGPKGLRTSITESKYKYKMVYWLEELARNSITFKLAGFTSLPMEKTDMYLSNYLIARQEHFKILKNQFIYIIIFKTIITAGLLIMGGLLVMNRQINLGQFIAAELIIVLVITAVEKLISNMDMIYDLLTALDKVGDVTDLPLEDNSGLRVDDIPGNEQFDISIKNLHYRYVASEKTILNNIHLHIKKGDRICIAGHNNAGKTTLIKLISGLLHGYEGVFAYCGVPMGDINIASYRDSIGENISNNEIFDGTIEENITVGKPNITLEKLLWAIKEVGLNDFLYAQPKGLQTRMVGSGIDLASNIKQKIILARSIVEKPNILVMDDDFFTEPSEKQHMIDVLLNRENEWAMVMVTNDPTMLQRADQVLFLHQGTIAAQGKYTEMILLKEFRNLINGGETL